jgi:hypothetical protein
MYRLRKRLRTNVITAAARIRNPSVAASKACVPG